MGLSSQMSNSFTCKFTHFSAPENKYLKGEIRSWFEFDFKADLRPAFDWNTHMIFAYLSIEFSHDKSDFNQVVFWDDRVMRSV